MCTSNEGGNAGSGGSVAKLGHADGRVSIAATVADLRQNADLAAVSEAELPPEAELLRIAETITNRRRNADRVFVPVGTELLTVGTVAAMLSVSRRTIHRLVARGELHGPVKVGAASRFVAEEVHEFVEQLKAGRRAGTRRGGKKS